ncbi:MAG TPA: Holliday junction resolvase RuvX [Gammaproteobacteria bacterium]|nr:Holliday junction resolvase RuvX [Gammaproteobacteria bacterium]
MTAAEPRTLLAFDFGLKRIGGAVGQTQSRSASPLETLAVKREHPDWRAIARLIETWTPDALVVGLPLNMDGTQQEMTHRARRFGRQLEGRFDLPVHLVDERLTTREAKSRLHLEGRASAGADPVAAQIILEGWLSEQSAPGGEAL